MTDRLPDMRRALGAKLREALKPVPPSGSTVDAEIAALISRLATRPSTPSIQNQAPS